MLREVAPPHVGPTRSSALLALPDIRMGWMVGEAPSFSSQMVAQEVIRKHFGDEPCAMAPVVNGLSNAVFIAETRRDGMVVIKIRQEGESTLSYEKARWAIGLATAVGVPAPHTLYIGTQNDHPYMVSCYMPGIPANLYEGDRTPVWLQLGEIAQRINAVRTFGQYRNFDDYITAELLPGLAPSYRKQWQLLDEAAYTKLGESIDRLRGVHFEPRLVHRDLVLRNVKVDENGKIVAVLDWDNASSHLAPSLEFALSFEDPDNENEGVGAFREGYGLTEEAYASLGEQIVDLRCTEYLRRLQVKIDTGDMIGAYIDEGKIQEFLAT